MKKNSINKMKHKIAVAVVLLTAVCSLSGAAEAQKKILRSAYLPNGFDLKTAVEAARQGRSKADLNILSEIKSAASENTANFLMAGQNLVGTWRVTVPGGFTARSREQFSHWAYVVGLVGASAASEGLSVERWRGREATWQPEWVQSGSAGRQFSPPGVLAPSPGENSVGARSVHRSPCSGVREPP